MSVTAFPDVSLYVEISLSGNERSKKPWIRDHDPRRAPSGFNEDGAAQPRKLMSRKERNHREYALYPVWVLARSILILLLGKVQTVYILTTQCVALKWTKSELLGAVLMMCLTQD